MAKNGILVATGPWPAEPWAAPVRAAEPARALQVWPELGELGDIAYALVWKPPEGLLARLPNLRVIFSLGAGVDHLVFQKDLPDLPIVRVVSADLTQRMTEWVALQVLMHHRRQRAYDLSQREGHWRELRQPAAADVRVGIMGMGVLGRDAAEVLVRLGFQVAGWSRSPSEVAGVEGFHGAGGLDPFLARTDILVCLLPLTPDTRGILSMPLFRKLARDGALGRGPAIINAGRGGLQVEADIVAAIEDGTLGGASLDVFEREPLDPASPLWRASNNVIITPHVAAASEPSAIVPLIIEQIRAFEAGRPLENLVDLKRAY
jgi:glyoxylate/hydroxypyruvate reductase A